MSDKCTLSYEEVFAHHDPYDRTTFSLRSMCMCRPFGRIKSIRLQREHLFGGEPSELQPHLEENFPVGVEYAVNLVVKQLETSEGVDFVPIPIFSRKRILGVEGSSTTISEEASLELVRLVGVDRLYLALVNRLIDTPY